MYVLKINMTADELNARVKNNLSVEEQNRFLETNFAVLDVHRDENMGIELTMVAVAEDAHIDAVNNERPVDPDDGGQQDETN